MNWEYFSAALIVQNEIGRSRICYTSIEGSLWI